MIRGFEFLNFRGDREFVVGDGDFSELEVRRSEQGALHYFYNKRLSRLVTDFVLDDRPRVATICTVTLIYNDGEYTPRLKFWKKDKTKVGQPPAEEEIPDVVETRMIKASVDTSEGHRNFWKLIRFLEECKEVSLPAGEFHIVERDSAEIAKLLQGSDKSEVVEAIRAVLGGALTQADLDIISNRKGQLDIFHKYLNDANCFERRRSELRGMGKDSKPEAVWQNFFEENPWIFGYGLSLIACVSFDDKKLEQITTGASLFGGAGKRSDGVMRTRGMVSSLLFCEIKRHDLPLLEARQYRKPDVYVPSEAVVGAVSQVQKTTEKAIRGIRDFLYRHYAADGASTDLEVSTIKPRQVVVVGSTGEFGSESGLNPEKIASFELYRRSVSDVEIITFDELYERACFIVRAG